VRRASLLDGVDQVPVAAPDGLLRQRYGVVSLHVAGAAVGCGVGGATDASLSVVTIMPGCCSPRASALRYSLVGTWQ
jgi:hypothetical protein